MAFGLKRSDCQKIAQVKLDDAILLFKNRRFSNSYYLAGYAVEIGLKACIARQIVRDTIPDKAFIEATHKHELRRLVSTAGLASHLKQQEDADPQFGAYWAIVAEWTPEKRYESVDSYSAQIMVQAIADPTTGVFEWIKKHW